MMIKLSSLLLFDLVLLLATTSAECLAQGNPKTGMKLGIELLDYASHSSGTFTKQPGFALGLFTDTHPLVSDFNNALSLRLELNFVRLVHYRVDDRFLYSYDFTLSQYSLDERLMVSSLELAVLPTYSTTLGPVTTFEVYAGPSVAIGTQTLTTNIRSRTVVDTLSFPGYPPFGEYNMAKYRVPLSLCVGTCCWYHMLVVDLRYKYTYIGGDTIFKYFNELYVQIGMAF